MMMTAVLSADETAIRRAIQVLKGGGLVVFPTDTVYGVGAHAFMPEAVEKLYTAKIRPRDRAIPILLAKSRTLPWWRRRSRRSPGS